MEDYQFFSPQQVVWPLRKWTSALTGHQRANLSKSPCYVTRELSSGQSEAGFMTSAVDFGVVVKVISLGSPVLSFTTHYRHIESLKRSHNNRHSSVT